jgi:uncharacterized membrane protein
MEKADATHEVRALNTTLKRNIRIMDVRREREEASAGLSERVAAAITRFTGSMTFVVIHLLVYGAWIIVNLGWVPGISPFDPTFVILASEASVEAIFLSTFVLISQNRMAAQADRRADLDLHINLLAEHELTKVAVLVSAIAAHLGIETEADDELPEVHQDVEPTHVLDELEATRKARD